jgi:hypothetical protein
MSGCGYKTGEECRSGGRCAGCQVMREWEKKQGWDEKQWKRRVMIEEIARRLDAEITSFSEDSLCEKR